MNIMLDTLLLTGNTNAQPEKERGGSGSFADVLGAIEELVERNLVNPGQGAEGGLELGKELLLSIMALEGFALVSGEAGAADGEKNGSEGDAAGSLDAASAILAGLMHGADDRGIAVALPDALKEALAGGPEGGDAGAVSPGDPDGLSQGAPGELLASALGAGEPAPEGDAARGKNQTLAAATQNASEESRLSSAHENSRQLEEAARAAQAENRRVAASSEADRVLGPAKEVTAQDRGNFLGEGAERAVETSTRPSRADGGGTPKADPSKAAASGGLDSLLAEGDDAVLKEGAGPQMKDRAAPSGRASTDFSVPPDNPADGFRNAEGPTAAQAADGANQTEANTWVHSVRSGPESARHAAGPNAQAEAADAALRASQSETGAAAAKSSSVKTLNMKLYPPNLAPLRVRVQVRGEEVKALFLLEGADMKHVIETGLPNLRDGLVNQGLNVKDLGVQVGTQSGGQTPEQHAGQDTPQYGQTPYRQETQRDQGEPQEGERRGWERPEGRMVEVVI